jgi:predicted nucleotidyltransferase
MLDSERQLLLAAARDALLAAFPNVWAIYVYGSFARGDESSASDVDLALLLPVEERIDLRREVLAEGRTLYVSRPDMVLEWEGTAISRYQRYREEVRDLLEDFQKTSVGYEP